MDNQDTPPPDKVQQPNNAIGRDYTKERIKEVLCSRHYDIPPIPTTGFLDVPDALDRLGQALFDATWLGLEAWMVNPQGNNVACFDEAWKRRERTATTMRMLLAEKVVSAKALEGISGLLNEVKSDFWRSDFGHMPLDIGSIGNRRSSGFGYLLIHEASLEAMLVKIRRRHETGTERITDPLTLISEAKAEREQEPHDAEQGAMTNPVTEVASRPDLLRPKGRRTRRPRHECWPAIERDFLACLRREGPMAVAELAKAIREDERFKQAKLSRTRSFDWAEDIIKKLTR